jgi:hypothetical protein
MSGKVLATPPLVRFRGVEEFVSVLESAVQVDEDAA